MLVEDFASDVNPSQWARVVGGAVEKPCSPVAFGNAIHFAGVRLAIGCFIEWSPDF